MSLDEKIDNCKLKKIKMIIRKKNFDKFIRVYAFN